MPLGSAASGITAGLTQGLQLLSTLDQRRRQAAQERAQGLNLYLKAVETATKHPEALPHIRRALQPYGMDLDDSIVADAEETRKAHGVISSFLASGDFESFSEATRTMPGIARLAAKNPTLLKLVEGVREKADTAQAVKRVHQGARERGIKPGDPTWNAYLREQAFADPQLGGLKGLGHLFGPEATTYQAQDPRQAAALAGAREFGQTQGRERARAMPYEDLVGGGVPQDITAFAGAGPGVAPAPPQGTPQLRWGPEDFSLRSGAAMALLGGQMDPVPPAPQPMAPPAAAPGASVRGAPARRTLADVEQARAIEIARAKAENAAGIRREFADEGAGVTWQPYYGAEGQVLGFYNPKNPDQTRPAPPGFVGKSRQEAGTGTWVETTTADGRRVLRNTKTKEIEDPAVPLRTPPPPAERPKKFADMLTVLGSARESPGIPPGPGEAKDAEKAAAVRARLILQFERDLDASRGDAAIAANSVMKRDGWDAATVRAAQGKTAKYLSQMAPAPAAPSAATPQAPARFGGAPAPAQQTREAAKAELRRLLEAGLTPQAAADAMRAAGWNIK